MKLTIPYEELITSGHTACQGCGAMLAMRYALKALGKNTIITIPACCQIVITGPVTHTNLKVPMFASAFASAGATASGIKAGLEMQGKQNINVVAWAGDGGTFDIGIQSLSAAAERNEDIFYFCYDNEAYMNTGRQRSSATPYGSWTMTTPKENLNSVPKKDIVEIMAAHKIPYIATLSIAYPEDFIEKVQKASKIRGTKFFHILSPCPSGWISSPEKTIEIARMAVKTRIFPLYEIEHGKKYTLNKNIKENVNVHEYFKLQGRFNYLSDDMKAKIQEEVDQKWSKLDSMLKY